MIDETLPEVVKQFLRAGRKLEQIRLHADGRWTHEGLDFENQRIIDLFHRSVACTAGGTWVLEIGQFTYPIVVDDCGYFVVAIDLETEPHPIALSDETQENLDLQTVCYDGDASIYCDVKGGQFRARFMKGPYLKFADRIESKEDGIWYRDTLIYSD